MKRKSKNAVGKQRSDRVLKIHCAPKIALRSPRYTTRYVKVVSASINSLICSDIRRILQVREGGLKIGIPPKASS
jgi:hypothetical protein